jgi:hypothetical protein
MRPAMRFVFVSGFNSSDEVPDGLDGPLLA